MSYIRIDNVDLRTGGRLLDLDLVSSHAESLIR